MKFKPGTQVRILHSPVLPEVWVGRTATISAHEPPVVYLEVPGEPELCAWNERWVGLVQPDWEEELEAIEMAKLRRDDQLREVFGD